MHKRQLVQALFGGKPLERGLCQQGYYRSDDRCAPHQPFPHQQVDAPTTLSFFSLTVPDIVTHPSASHQRWEHHCCGCSHPNDRTEDFDSTRRALRCEFQVSSQPCRGQCKNYYSRVKKQTTSRRSPSLVRPTSPRLVRPTYPEHHDHNFLWAMPTQQVHSGNPSESQHRTVALLVA